MLERKKELDEQERLHQELNEVRLSVILATIRNVNGGKGNGIPYKPEDFYIPSWKKPTETLEEPQVKIEKPKKWEDLVKMVEEQKAERKKKREQNE